MNQVADEELPRAQRQRGFSPTEKREALVTLIAAGGDRVEDIRILSEDKGRERRRGGPLPSPDTLLDFLGQFHDPACWADRPPDKKSFVPQESAERGGLDAINRAVVARGADPRTTTATIDHDGTIIESHKREAPLAYEGTRGDQRLVAVWAEEQLVVADEFRDGNVAGGEDPLSSVKRAFANLPSWGKERFFRSDSAAYYTPRLKHLVAEQIGFSISADMGKELRASCLAVPAGKWVPLETRAREQGDLAEVEFAPGNWPKQAAPLRYVAMRCTPLQADLFEAKTPKYLAVVSNRRELSPAELVRWHWEKAGTIEHVHRVRKDELSAGVMPSGRFGVNAAWFRINALTFNLLTVLKRRALPERYRLPRPKRLRFEVFTTPGKLVVHQSRLSVRASATEPRLTELVTAPKRLLAMLDAAHATGS